MQEEIGKLQQKVFWEVEENKEIIKIEECIKGIIILICKPR
jgi:hypothetical protein